MAVVLPTEDEIKALAAEVAFLELRARKAEAILRTNLANEKNQEFNAKKPRNAK